MHVEHEFKPIFDDYSKILILGTMPSVKSRETHFYYGHPRNRFWKVLASITEWNGSTGEFIRQPETIEEKKQMLLSTGIAIWDVVSSCEIEGSSDSSISNVVPNNITELMKKTRIDRIYANGAKAEELYLKYCFENSSRKIIKLPSTSPANAAYSLERLIEIWKSKLCI